MRPTGAIKLTPFLTALAVAGGVYWLAVFAPVLLVDHWEVKDKVNEVFNSYHVTPSPVAARQTLQTKLAGLRFMSHFEKNRLGNDVEVFGLPTTDFNPHVFYDDVRETLLIRYEYDRQIRLYPTDKIYVVHLTYERHGNPYR
ncbi:MAG: hypothetical protein JNG84_10690 [Archangium sp.]|nr:hypothetical protein [Archangium sp.]